jgi:hypothetical protein
MSVQRRHSDPRVPHVLARSWVKLFRRRLMPVALRRFLGDKHEASGLETSRVSTSRLQNFASFNTITFQSDRVHYASYRILWEPFAFYRSCSLSLSRIVYLRHESSVGTSNPTGPYLRTTGRLGNLVMTLTLASDQVSGSRLGQIHTISWEAQIWRHRSC